MCYSVNMIIIGYIIIIFSIGWSAVEKKKHRNDPEYNRRFISYTFNCLLALLGVYLVYK